MLVKDMMTRDPQTIAPDATLQQAAEKMKKLDVGVLPVCDGDRLVGMVTDRDLAIRGVAACCDPADTRVSAVMTEDALHCYEDDDVQDAVQTMEDAQIRRIAVFNRNERLIGIVSLGDIATRLHDDQISGEALERISEPLHS